MKKQRTIEALGLLAVMACVLIISGFQVSGGLGTSWSQQVTVSGGGSTSFTSTGASNVFRDIGQSSHWLQYCVTGSPTSVAVELEGSPDNVSYQQISEIGTQTSGCGILEAGGYYRNIRANVLTLSGGASPAITMQYSATAFPIPGGGLNRNAKTSQPVTLLPAQGFVNTNLKSTLATVSSSAGAVYGGTVQNTTNAVVYLVIEDTSQTVGTATITQPIEANTANSGIRNLPIPSAGVQFTGSISVGCTTSLSVATDPATGCVVNLFWKPSVLYNNNIVGGSQSGPKPVAPPI